MHGQGPNDPARFVLIPPAQRAASLTIDLRVGLTEYVSGLFPAHA